MILESIKYTRLKGQPKEWSIIGCDNNPVCFGNINLIVGKNAAGKSRTLTVLKEVAGLLSTRIKLSTIPYSTFSYQMVWKEGNKKYEYSFAIENGIVEEESLFVNGELKLERTKGLIYSEFTGKMESLTVDRNLLSVTIHDSIAYPYLTDVYHWGGALRFGLFSNQSEKNYILDDISRLHISAEMSSNNPLYLLQAFWMGKHLFNETFVNAVKTDMKMLQYPIEAVNIMEGGGGYSICVKEDELDDVTNQYEMSQGMYRALSFIIHFNFALLSNLSVCVLIDDLGEGLDFDRSRRLIALLEKKIENTNMQIFITSNDRYVMNKIPLRLWSVIERYPKKSVFYNYCNSKTIFDDFQFTGLNNFDFLATDFYLKGFDETEDVSGV